MNIHACCVVAATSLAILTACSSSNSGGSSDGFVGTWSCSGTYALTFTAPAGTPPYSGTTQDIDTIVDAGGGAITVQSQNDAGAGCTIKATVSGNTATLESAQSCPLSDGLTLTYTSGTSTLNSSGYSSTYKFSFSGMITVRFDSGTSVTVSASGSGTGSSNCTKQ
jgi:hypothetical protein